MGLADLAKKFDRRPRLSPEQLKGAKPLRNPAVLSETIADGSEVLRAPLITQGRGIAGWMAKRMNAPDVKTFELEPVGAFVWHLCDGQHTFETISRKLRNQFKMNRLEADASLTAFLQMLSQRRLITLMVGKEK